MQTETDTGRPAPGLDDRDATSPDGNSRHPVAHLAAGCLAGAAIIHFAMVPQHAGDSLLDPIGFAVAGWAQLWLAAALLRRDARDSTHGIAIVVNLALIGVWLWSRTSGLPWGAHAGVAEEIGAVDLIAVALQTVAVLASIAVLGTSAPVRRSSALTPLIGGVAALGLATAAIVSPDAASHGHTGETAVAAGGHAHGANGTDANHAGEMQLVDDTRCDQGFNPAVLERGAHAGCRHLRRRRDGGADHRRERHVGRRRARPTRRPRLRRSRRADRSDRRCGNERDSRCRTRGATVAGERHRLRSLALVAALLARHQRPFARSDRHDGRCIGR